MRNWQEDRGDPLFLTASWREKEGKRGKKRKSDLLIPPGALWKKGSLADRRLYSQKRGGKRRTSYFFSLTGEKKEGKEISFATPRGGVHRGNT